MNRKQRTPSQTSTWSVTKAVLSTVLLFLLPVRAAVISPNQLVSGKSYSQWTAASWQWGLQIPDDGHHPWKDRTGGDALRAQTGPVLFLGSSAVGSVTRHITIPNDASLFLEVASVECSTVENPPFYGGNEAELRACAESFATENLICEIDGEPVSGLDAFHVTSPMFSVYFPLQNLFGVRTGQAESVASGVAVMLTPLAPGSHTLFFGGGHVGGNDTVYVTYEIEVYTRPALSIRTLRSPDLVELSWQETPGFILQQSAQSSGNWTAAAVLSSSVTDSIRSVTLSPEAGLRFFRLCKP